LQIGGCPNITRSDAFFDARDQCPHRSTVSVIDEVW
jgi:hypothetical protein